MQFEDKERKSSSESEGEDEESDDESEDGTDTDAKKSRDGEGGHKDDKNDEPDFDQGEEAQQMPVVVLDAPGSSTDETSDDEDLNEQAKACKTKEDFTKLKKVAEERARFYIMHFQNAKKGIKDIEKIENKAKAEKAKANKKLEMAEKKESEKLAVVVINCNYAGKSFTIKTNRGETLLGVCLAIGAVLKMTKQTAKKLAINIGDKPLECHNRKSIGGIIDKGLFKEGEVWFISTGLRGGGKRKKEDAMVVVLSPHPHKDDPSCVLKAISMQNIDIKGWVYSLSKDELKSFVQVLDRQPRSGNVAGIIPPYLRFVKEWEDMKVP